MPGGELEAEGERDSQPTVGGSATTKIGGKLTGSTVITFAKGTSATTEVGEDAKDSDILTETKK